MTSELKIVCELLGKALFKSEITTDLSILPDADWYEIYKTCSKQTVLPTVAPVIPQSAPKELRYQWIADIYQIEKHNYINAQAHLLIHEMMTDHNIPYVFLKGPASLEYYPDHSLRNQGDVDFLINPASLGEAEQILTENGFNIISDLPYEKDFEKDGISFDLHIEINGIPEGKCGEAVNSYLNEIQNTAICRTTDGHTLIFPNDFYHGLILLLHTARHMVGFGLGLRQICDWAVFANSIGDRFSVLFEAPLKEMGLWKFAQSLTAVCEKFLNMPHYSWVADFSDDFLDKFMDDLTRKGNLSHDEEDKMDTLLVENSNHGGTGKKPMLFQFFHNLGEKAKYRWHFMEKWKILIPFGIVIMCIQYGIGMITGKYKKINVSEMISDANDRKKLYDEIALFVMEK